MNETNQYQFAFDVPFVTSISNPTSFYISKQIHDWVIDNMDKSNWYWVSRQYRIGDRGGRSCVMPNMTESQAALFRLAFSELIIEMIRIPNYD